MLNKELKYALTLNSDEKASARDIVEDAYEDAHSVNGIVYADNPSDNEMIETINRILPDMDTEDAKALIDLKYDLECNILKDWIAMREPFFSMSAVVDKLTSLNYVRYKNAKYGKVQLSKSELLEIKKAMKMIVKDEFSF